MQAGGYGDQQVAGALLVLATTDQPLRERLRLAWTHHLAIMDPKVDLATELQDDFASIAASMKRLDQLTSSDVQGLAARIVELEDRVQEIVNNPRQE